ncbi:MAG TPA: DmsC/YnfH family molybdoenzyme membrane anchor subunit [Caldimonas sp.]|jgi:DMSO reductase anchor subunit|nr:DmsC/YnfH family molybdoenzyme membrane anchor subunit [Caldimonas sp.]HEX2542709.1 DmsC/YnfH family molybdoenzyme membrane anchor subunit [Caldimonas sp.]
MNPAFSVVVFTTLAGAAQGLAVLLAVAVLDGVPVAASFVSGSLLLVIVMLVGALGASFLHLGRPERAWRAVAMWRTSWLSREVIVLPAFIGLVALWWLAVRADAPPWLLRVVMPVLVVAVSSALWYCTAMIYACLRFIEEWAQPLTLVNFAVLGLSSGCLCGAALAAFAGEARLLALAGPAALAITLLAWATRMLALRRNDRLRHRSTLQTATGIRSPRLVQKAMGMTGGSFNTREFFHPASPAAARRVRLGGVVLAFALPALLAAWGLVAGGVLPWLLAVLVQAPGLVADRWTFFAQARHPQNLYYQVVS